MARSRKKTAPVPRARNTHSHQRQRLIEACISALHIYGPSRTTVEKVVAIAKMSPGIVRFYFASKAAMLVASLQFLATEFEQQLMVPVGRLKARPVEALELLVELYLDPEIATPRKVSVWYAFWGEASSRQEYYDICGQKDESFAALVRELIERLIADTGQAQLDPDGIALGLIGVLEILWQDFAFQDEADIDRPAAKRRAMAYLRSVFPGQFGGEHPGGGGASRTPVLKAWAFDNSRLFALERANVFQCSWQFVAPRAALQMPGDFVTNDLGAERALVVLDETGAARAFRNSCPAAPHALLTAGRGRAQEIVCPVHGLNFGLDGAGRGGGGTFLTPLELHDHGELLLVRSQRPKSASVDAWSEVSIDPDATALPLREMTVAADWKLLTETLLSVNGGAQTKPWSARRYATLAGFEYGSKQRFVAPNHWVDSGADGFSVVQVLSLAPGRTLLRRYRYSYGSPSRAAEALRYLSERVGQVARPAALDVAASTQRGALSFGYQPSVDALPAADDFRRQLLSLLPLLAHARPPTE